MKRTRTPADTYTVFVSHILTSTMKQLVWIVSRKLNSSLTSYYIKCYASFTEMTLRVASRV